jgi:hypothetical protein
MNEFSERKCPVCGEPLNVLRGGKEIVLRCTCDWEKGFHERTKRTIHPSFYVGGVKKMVHWRPPMFNVDPQSQVYNFMVAQKVIAIRRIYDFSFTKDGLEGSIAKGRNLFVRGPKGSGRGLIVASIKFYAAAKDISATPVSGDWALFKNEVMEAESYSKQGEMAKASLGQTYVNVDLMTLENIRAEPGLLSAGRKIRGASVIDMVLAKRQAKQGSMVFSSFDFAREFGETFGDKLVEIINDDSTSMALLFSPQESDVIVKATENKLEQSRKAFYDMAGKTRKKNWNEELKDQDEDERTVFDLMACSSLLSASEEVSVELAAYREAGDNPYLRSLLKHVEADRLDDPLSHDDRLRRTVIEILRKSRHMSDKMTDKEVQELATIMRLSSDPVLDEDRRLAVILKKKMSGESSVEEDLEAETLLQEASPW